MKVCNACTKFQGLFLRCSQKLSTLQTRGSKCNSENYRDNEQYQRILDIDSNPSGRDVESRWNGIESDYRKKHPSVTNEDVDYRSGEFDNMTDRIAKRTNRNRNDVNGKIRNWDS